MPKYTIIMPAKNAESTITRSITSTLKAFPRDTHIAIWDDASEDRTAEFAQRVDTRRVLLTTSCKSVGSGLARQRLIDSTDSEFIVIQDADDISLPWRHRLQSQQLTDADFSFAAAQRFSDTKHIYRPSLPFHYNPTDTSISLVFHNPLAHSTMIARRDALADIGGYSASRVAQDYELLLRAATAGKRISRIGIPTVLYRISSTQISSQREYASRIVGSTEICSAYGRHLEHLLPEANFKFEAPTSLPELKNKISYKQVEPLVAKLRPHLRPYYRHLLSNHRFGHLAAEVLS